MLEILNRSSLPRVSFGSPWRGGMKRLRKFPPIATGSRTFRRVRVRARKDIGGVAVGRRAAAISAGASDSAFDQHRLDFGDGLGRIETFGASLGAIENGVAAIQSKRVFKIIEPRSGRFVAAVDDPTARLQQRGRPEIAIAVPPIAGAAAAAAGAQDALVETVELGTIFLAL